MNQDSDEILIEVLGEIGYEGNKLAFVQKFTALCHYKACWEMVGRLPESDQAAIKKDVPEDVTPNALLSILRKWYSDQDYIQALSYATKQAFSNSFRNLIEMMSDAKQERVKLLLGKAL